MTHVTVNTQAELDAALTNPDHAFATREIIIDSPAGVRLTVGDDHGQDVRARGSSSVTAFGSSSVTACDSSAVRACDSSAVRAYDSASVIAFDSPVVTAFDSSAVHAYGSSTVTAFGSASVIACDSSAVHAFGSSSVRAYDSASVRAHDSSSVTAFGSASVRAFGSASVRASTYVAVQLHSTRVTHTGGVIIDCTTIDETDPATWGGYHGAHVEDGTITLYKCLPQNLTSGADWGRDTVWPTSGDIGCVDFEATDECGHGLHLSPTPGHAWTYRSNVSRPRLLEVTAPLDGIVPITGGTAKCKVRSCTVVREVDVMGRPVTSEAAKS